MKIAEIRDTIDRLNNIRNWLSGGTHEENTRTRFDEGLAPYIAEVEALQIPARFAKDIERRADALKYAAAAIERWKTWQTPPAPTPAPQTNGLKRALTLFAANHPTLFN